MLKNGGKTTSNTCLRDCIKASHCFNLLDSRGVISVNERQAYILRIRSLVQKCCQTMIEKMNEFL